MNPTWRKPAGMLGIIVYIIAWVVLVTTFSAEIATLHWLAQLIVYVVLGIIWIAPLKPVLRWMETGRWHAD